MKKKVAVIGAGISGLTCAYELQKAGFEVTVFEKEKTVGGRMATREVGMYAFDIGADHLCNLYTEMMKYCEEFGIEWIPMDFLGYQLFRDGKLYSLTKAISLTSRIRLALATFFSPKTASFFNLTDLVDYDNDNAYDYMKRKAGKEVADYLVDSFVSTYQFHRADEISKAALLGIIHSIKKDNVRWNLHRMKGGMSALPEAFAARLPMKMSSQVEWVITRDGRVVIRETGVDRTFDAVVFATTAPVTKQLLHSPTEGQEKLLEGSRYATSLSISFEIPKGIMPHNAIYWVPYVESKKISGYVNELMKGEESVNEDRQVVNCWLHEEFAKQIIGKSDKEIFHEIKGEFIRVSPWFNKKKHDIKLYDVQRWPEAMPVFSQGHLTRVKDFLETDQGKDNIWFTGDYLNSPWTEGALRCGQRVAKAITSTLS